MNQTSMQKIFFSITASLMLVFSLLFYAQPAFAATGCSAPIQNQVNDLGGADAVKGLPAYCDAFSLIKKVLDTLFAVAGAIAVLLIVIGGFQYMFSAGNVETAKKARNTILYAVIGLVVVIMATAIVNVVTNFITQK